MSTLEKTTQSNLLDTPSSLMDSITSNDFKRRLLWHGVFLCTLGFIAGLFIPLYANPRTGLATHLLGITQGLFLAVIGLSYPQLKISTWLARVTYWLLFVSAYVGMLGEFLGAAFGLSRTFIVTAKGLPEGILWLENVVDTSIKTISLFVFFACFVVLYGLRKTKSDSNSQ